MLDGLVLHGGSDVWPGSYGEEPLKPEWSGDRVRDEYEIALLRAFIDAGKPVLGVCRGLQVINVAFGGTLYQDITTQQPGSGTHRDAALYDQNFHEIEFVPDTRLADLYPDVTRARVNSVHHQGVKKLADGFTVEATSPDDGMIEAMRWTGSSYVNAVQWHPEFLDWKSSETLSGDPILNDFLAATEANQSKASMLTVRNPATGSTIAELPQDDAQSIAAKYSAARAAQPAWAATPLQTRIDTLRSFRDALTADVERLAAVLTSETGKPIRQAKNEINGLRARIDFFLESTEADDCSARRAQRSRHARADFARAARRHRQYLGVELPLLRRRQRIRAGAADRQRGAVQAVRICGADRNRDRKAAASIRCSAAGIRGRNR